jgi:hypothetical protein
VTRVVVMEGRRRHEQVFPPNNRVDDLAGMALCVNRDDISRTVQLETAVFRLNVRKAVSVKRHSFVFPESSFDSPGVYFVGP